MPSNFVCIILKNVNFWLYVYFSRYHMYSCCHLNTEWCRKFWKSKYDTGDEKRINTLIYCWSPIWHPVKGLWYGSSLFKIQCPPKVLGLFIQYLLYMYHQNSVMPRNTTSFQHELMLGSIKNGSKIGSHVSWGLISIYIVCKDHKRATYMYVKKV